MEAQQSLAQLHPTAPGNQNDGGTASRCGIHIFQGLAGMAFSILQHHRIGHQHRKSPSRAAYIRPEIQITNQLIS